MRRVLLAGLLLLVCGSCDRQASTPPALPTLERAGKQILGKTTGRISIRDPVWGELVATTSIEFNTGDFETDCGQPHLRVVDASHRVRLSRDWAWGCGEIRLNEPATDGTGNVFLRYNPGRYDGVIVLRALGGRIEDFGTLPPDSQAAGTDDYEGSGPMGYYAKTLDQEPTDGILEIRQFHHDCDPSCAEGPTTSEIFRWDGRRYVSP